MTEDEALERIATEQLLTVDQAAHAVGVSPWTIRQWMNRGHLQPVPGIQPFTFFETDIYQCRTARRGPSRAARVSSAARTWHGVQSDAGRTTLSA
jgi:hypothetical protein